VRQARGFLSSRVIHWIADSGKPTLTFLRGQSARAKATLKTVEDFFTDDSNSNLSPGKKEFSHRGGETEIKVYD